MLLRGRTLTTCAMLATCAAFAGCTSAASTTSVSGSALSIYVSLPPGTLTPEEQDVVSAERLAFRQAGAQAGKYTVKLVQFGGKKLSDNARQAIGDDTTIAYLGELAPGASGDTLGITNAQQVLQVTPTDTAVEVTQHSPAVPNSPDRYYESLSANGRTFARVVPTTALEAKALVGQMQTLGVRRLYVKSDGSAYGAALAYAVTADVGGAGITTVSSATGVDGVLYAGASPAQAAASFNQLVSGNPSVKLFAPSALAQNAFAAALSPAAQRLTYVSSPGFTSSDLTPQGQQFVSAFKAAYGHAPAAQAIFGYEAMAAVMSVLHKAGSGAGNRNTVVKDFFGIRNRTSVLGTYSINQNGDTNIGPFVISRIKGGGLVPYRAVQEQG